MVQTVGEEREQDMMTLEASGTPCKDTCIELGEMTEMDGWKDVHKGYIGKLGN